LLIGLRPHLQGFTVSKYLSPHLLPLEVPLEVPLNIGE